MQCRTIVAISFLFSIIYAFVCGAMDRYMIYFIYLSIALHTFSRFFSIFISSPLSYTHSLPLPCLVGIISKNMRKTENVIAKRSKSIVRRFVRLVRLKLLQTQLHLSSSKRYDLPYTPFRPDPREICLLYFLRCHLCDYQ